MNNLKTTLQGRTVYGFYFERYYDQKTKAKLPSRPATQPYYVKRVLCIAEPREDGTLHVHAHLIENRLMNCGRLYSLRGGGLPIDVESEEIEQIEKEVGNA